jgi:hypothetical protein
MAKRDVDVKENLKTLNENNKFIEEMFGKYFVSDYDMFNNMLEYCNFMITEISKDKNKDYQLYVYNDFCVNILNIIQTVLFYNNYNVDIMKNNSFVSFVISTLIMQKTEKDFDKVPDSDMLKFHENFIENNDIKF